MWVCDGSVINIIITILIIIHRPPFLKKVSETRLCLRLQVEPTRMGPIERASLDTSLRNIMF
jgi:hypothetical protein